MPGILPMKVIKVGNDSQSRIAQACDRCRCKKIRCDGIRPCCTQCANVGFECKTDDKLRRRAFPRGYTESLEEQVRMLEAEVNDLKGLLDEKDETIDVLSRIHSFSLPSQERATTSVRRPSEPVKSHPPDAGESVIQVQETSQFSESVDTECTGISSTSGYVDVFVNRLMDEGRLPPNVSTQALTASAPAIPNSYVDQAIQTAPRLVSDQLINIFFQEWAPLYPVVHRTTALKAYERYISHPESQGSKHDTAQLNLIFGISALASAARTNQDPTFFEQIWSPVLESLSGDISISTLQCFVLSQIYCMAKGDYTGLLRYRGLGINLCHQLRLHQNQEQSIWNLLRAETRKKVFWCQYVLDRFAAALTGLPVLLREEDIRTEYPKDVDDENVTEMGFLPTLPGEPTRISSAIALFGASRILNKALEDLYPSDRAYEISVSKLRSVAGQLDAWVNKLPSHLRLEFSKDKPSADVTGSRSPLLSLVFYFIRSLIHRPAICFGNEHTHSSSVLIVSDSSKRIIRILQLLDERRLCLSVNISRKELVLSSGLGLLWQNISLGQDSKLIKENKKFLLMLIDQLGAESSAAAAELSMLAGTLVPSNKRAASDKHQGMSLLDQKSANPPEDQTQALDSDVATRKGFNQPTEQDSASRRNTISNDNPHISQLQVRSLSDANVLGAESPHPLQVSADENYYPSDLMGYGIGQTISNPAQTISNPESLDESIAMLDWEFTPDDNMFQGCPDMFTGVYGSKDFGEDSEPFVSLAAGEYVHTPNLAAASLPDPGLQLQEHSKAWSAISDKDIPSLQEIAAQNVFSYLDDSMGSAKDATSCQ